MAELIVLLKIFTCPTSARSLQHTRTALLEIVGQPVTIYH